VIKCVYNRAAITRINKMLRKKDWNDDAMLMTSISLQSLLIKWRSQHSNIDSDGSRPTSTGLKSLKSTTKWYKKDRNNDAMLMTLILLQSLLIKWRSQHSNIDSNGSRPTKTTNVLAMRISTFGAIWTVMLINLLRSSINELIPAKSSGLRKASLLSEWQ
jgi:hypothetical protein